MKSYSFGIKGMKCNSCVQEISSLLGASGELYEIDVNLQSRTLHFQSHKSVSLSDLNSLLRVGSSKMYEVFKVAPIEEKLQFFNGKIRTYWPLILLFLLSAGLPFLMRSKNHNPNLETWMCDFMGVTLVALSYFKLVDIKSFSAGFATYDPLAGKFPVYARIYPFLELISGIYFLMGNPSKLVYFLTSLFLGITTVGVFKELRKGKKIQCACMGSYFKLPLTTVTIFENSLMISMSLVGLF